jgi:hypothetical protein
VKAFILNALGKMDDRVYEIVAKELERMGWETDVFHLHDKKIAPCQGCYGCFIKTPGICLIDDDGREIAGRAVQSDLMIFLTPVTFGGYSSLLKNAVDRFIQIVLPFFMKINGEYHHKPRYVRYPHLVGIGVLPHPDEESEGIFKTLVARNALTLISSSNTAGVVFRDYTPERIREEIKSLFGGVGVYR